MTSPSAAPAEQVARDFLRAHRPLFRLVEAEIAALRLIHQERHDGVTYLRFRQTLNGIDVFEGQIRVTLDSQGRVMEAGFGEVIPGLTLATNPGMTPEDAIRTAFDLLGLDPPDSLARVEGDFERQVRFRNPNGAHLADLTAELTIFPVSLDTAELGYHMLIEVDSKGWYDVVVDANSRRLLYVRNMYVNAASGRVWKQSPLVGSRDLIDFPDAWFTGQVTAGVTTGNNVDAYLDADGNNQADKVDNANMKSGRAYNAGMRYDFPMGDRNSEESPVLFQPAAVTNLFYFVNTAHDYYYSLGFDEAAGNYQKSNFEKGGKENDQVNAQAQDGASEDNAAFVPTPDGTPARMHVGLFTYGYSSSGATNWNDADYDGQVVMHEYGHGVTTRIVGGLTDMGCLSGTQSGAMGEGWSDYFAISFFNNPVLGAYSSLSPYTGVRRNSYERYPYTYQDLGNHGFEVHNDGEIWAATLWDLRKVLGQEATDKLVMAGLHFTPCRPAMTDARDGILAADNAMNGGANRAAIWTVFARHGMGQSAGGLDGFSRRGTVFTAAYDLPADLAPGNQSPVVTSHSLPIPGCGDKFTYTMDAADPDGGTLAYQLVSGPDGMTVSDSGTVQWTAGFLGAPVQIAVTDGQGGRVVHGFYLFVQTPLMLGTPVRVNGVEGQTAYASLDVKAGAPYLQVTLRDGNGDADLWISDPRGVYVGASLRYGSTETLTIPAPAAGTWGIEVDGYRQYNGVSLVAATPTPIALAFPAASVVSLNGDISSETIYKITVPANESLLTLSTTGGSGDVDLYLRKGTVGCSIAATAINPCRYDLRSATKGNNEKITVTNPGAADYYLDLVSTVAYSGVNLTLSSGPGLAISPASLTFTATVGGTALDQALKITERNGGNLVWTAQAQGGAWLKIAPTDGDATTPMTVSVVTTGLAAGTYTASIVVTSPGVAASPQTIPVKLVVQ